MRIRTCHADEEHVRRTPEEQELQAKFENSEDAAWAASNSSMSPRYHLTEIVQRRATYDLILSFTSARVHYCCYRAQLCPYIQHGDSISPHASPVMSIRTFSIVQVHNAYGS